MDNEKEVNELAEKIETTWYKEDYQNSFERIAKALIAAGWEKRTPNPDLKEKIVEKLLAINHFDLLDLSQESDPCRLDDHWCRHLGDKAICKINNKPISSLKRCPSVYNEASNIADDLLSLLRSSLT